MTGKRLFLKWVLFASLILVGAIFAANLGWVGYLTRDPSHFTYVTLAVFALALLRCGKLAWRLSGPHDANLLEADLARATNASDNCMYIGMAGTALGLLLMLEHAMTMTEPTQLMGVVVSNAYLAVVNTFFGIICGVLIRVQTNELATQFRLQHPEKKEGAS